MSRVIRGTFVIVIAGVHLSLVNPDRLVAALPGAVTAQGGVNASQPEVSPDGRFILAARADRATRSFQAFIMNADGSNRRDVAATRLSWFPDGSKILGFKEYGRDDRAVVVMNPDGTGEVAVGIRGSIGAAHMLPQGRLLLARTTRDTVRRIQNWSWFVRAQNGAETPLSFAVPAGQLVTLNVAPSRDGQRLAFLALKLGSADTSEHKAALYVVNVDGSGLRKLTEVQQDAGGIAWSKDHRTLALADSYTPHPVPEGFVGDANILTVDVGSGVVRRLTTHDRRYLDEHPSWGPDGSIYFQSDRDGQVEIYRMNADGSNQRRITLGAPS